MTSAAKQLHLTQSAVSWKIKRLEERVGAPLTSRDGRELVITELGVELLHHAELLVSAHDVAVDSLQRSKLQGTIHLGMNDEPDAMDVAGVLSRFTRRHPLVRLHIRVGRSDPIAKEIQIGQLDLGLIQTLHRRKTDEVLWTETLQWVCSPTFELAEDAPVPLVAFGPESMYMPTMVEGLGRAGRSHYLAFEAEYSPAVRNAIMAGFGVGILHERSVDQGLRPWTTPGLVHDLPMPAFVLRVSSRSRSQAVRALVDEILSSAL